MKLSFDYEKLTTNYEILCSTFASLQQKQSLQVAHTLLGVHGTSFKNLLGILKDKKIYSYKQLTTHRPSVVNNNLYTTTDILDKEVGLDNFAFLSLGRVANSDLIEHYLLFDHEVIKTKNAIASLLEIADLGALVSHEAAGVYKQFYNFTDATVQQVNKRALHIFQESITPAIQFDDIFNAFYNTQYTDLLEYASEIAYPLGTPLGEPPFNKQLSYWQGPQLMIPRSLSIEEHLRSIIDVYGVGNLSHTIEKKFGIKKQKIISCDMVAKEVFGISLGKRAGEGMSQQRLTVLNVIILFMGEFIDQFGKDNYYGSDSLIPYMQEIVGTNK